MVLAMILDPNTDSGPQSRQSIVEDLRHEMQAMFERRSPWELAVDPDHKRSFDTLLDLCRCLHPNTSTPLLA